MKQRELRLTIAELLNLYENGKLLLKLSSYKNIDVSRKEVWDNKKKSMFLNSILNNFFTSPIILAKKKDFYEVISGKQRLVSIINFNKTNFALCGTTPNVDGEVVSDKRIWQLSAKLKNRYYDYKLSIIECTGTIAEYLDLYVRYNDSNSMKAIEIFRAKLGKNLEILEDICNHTLFSLLTLNGGTERYQNYEVALYFLMLETNPALGLGKKEKEAYIERISNGGVIPKNIIKNINDKLDYLFKAFYNHDYLSLDRDKYLKKSHIIIIYQFIQKAFDCNIKERDFFKWCHSFFYLNKNSRYEYWIESSRGSTYSKSSMDIRYEKLEVSFYKYFKKSTSGIYIVK